MLRRTGERVLTDATFSTYESVLIPPLTIVRVMGDASDNHLIGARSFRLQVEEDSPGKESDEVRMLEDASRASTKLMMSCALPSTKQFRDLCFQLLKLSALISADVKRPIVEQGDIVDIPQDEFFMNVGERIEE
jgi:hypothetical protein